MPESEVQPPALANATISNETSVPPANAKDQGWSWNDCDFRSVAFVHKHEFAAAMVPPGYRQIDNGANIGNNVLLAFRCGGASIGNQTFFPNVTWAVYGISVQAPEPAYDAARYGLFVLGVYVDSEPLAEQLRTALPHVEAAKIDLTDANWNITTSQPVLDIHSAGKRSPPPDTTALWRLHMDEPDRLCWMDMAIVIQHLSSVELVAEAPSGAPNQVSGRTGVLSGLGFTARADGTMMGVNCVGAAA